MAAALTEPAHLLLFRDALFTLMLCDAPQTCDLSSQGPVLLPHVSPGGLIPVDA